MTIKLPMDVEIEMNTRLPYDFDDIIRKIFKEYLGEAKTENLDFNKLKFIDLCIASIRNSKDAKEAVQDIMLKQTEYRLRMLNQFPEKNSFFNMNFMAHYYEMGRASTGDYIIRGLRGEYYPCKPDVFQKKYEPCE